MKQGQFGATLAGAAFLAGAFGISAAALAEGTGKNGQFTIKNETANNTVVGFYTNDGSGWSKNWLSSNLKPGDERGMKFTKPGGKCKQTLRVGWLGKSGGEVKDDPINIDICDASNVYLRDNKVTYD